MNNDKKNYVGFEDLDAELAFTNFSGLKTKYNPEGCRNFCLVVPADVAIDLANAGESPNAWGAPWKINLEKPYAVASDGTPISYTLKVAVSYSNNKFNPVIKLITGAEYDSKNGRYFGGKTMFLTENNVGILDGISASRIAVRIRPRFWEDEKNDNAVNIKAYLERLDVIVEKDSFDDLYAEDYAPGDEAPFSI